MKSPETVSVEPEPRGSGRGQAQAFLYLVLRADQPLQPGMRWSLDALERVELRRGPGPGMAREGSRLLLDLGDSGISSNHAQLRKSGSRWRIQDLGSKNGTSLNGKRVQEAFLADGDLIEVGHTFLLFRGGVVAAPGTAEHHDAAQMLGSAPGLATMVPALAEGFARLESIARTRITVVIAGETGTGKEVVASAVHKLSGRAGEFQAVNCGALPRTLVESELFGYRKGAFSGADEDRQGLVRSADRGTLVLDELGDLPLAAQASLLRVLQESEVVPLGGTRPVKVDLRLVVATHRDLDALVEQGGFRADLFARISGFALTLPPLRERREDLGLLIASVLRRHAPGREGVVFTPEAARALLLHGWPLNIRELDKCLATALALCRSGRIELSHLPQPVRAALDEAPAAPARGAEFSGEDRERREELIAVLREHRGNVSAVASALGKHRNQINRWLKRFAIDPAGFRS